VRARRAWTVAWIGGAVLGVLNGTVRESTYRARVGERRAEQLSTLSLVAALAAYFSILDRRWPIPDASEAFRIGRTWVVLTVGFEFGFGHYLDPNRKSWSELAANYHLARGRLWPLVLAFMLVGPDAVRRLHRRRA